MPDRSSLHAPFWRRPSARIEVGTDSIRVVLTEGLLQRRERPVLDSATDGAVTDAATVVGQIRQVIEQSGVSRMPVDITLPDGLARMWVVAPPANAASLDDCQAAAQLRFASLFGAAPTGWTIRADWNARHAFLACALPTTLIDQIVALCDARGLTPRCIMPRFVSVWNRYCRRLTDGAWLATLTGQLLTVGVVHNGRLAAVRSVPVTLAGLSTPGWLTTHLQREALLLDTGIPTSLHVLGELPAQWLHHPGTPFRCVPLEG